MISAISASRAGGPPALRIVADPPIWIEAVLQGAERVLVRRRPEGDRKITTVGKIIVAGREKLTPDSWPVVLRCSRGVYRLLGVEA